jgi:glycosyltransferase involved in cell wall biosynthesis
LRSRFWRPGFAVLGLAEALRSATPDLIHIGPLPYNSLMYAGLRAAAGKRIPVVSTPCTHFGEERSTEIAQQYVQPHQIALLQHCDKVLCMMESERARLQELGVPPAKLAVASHGVTMASVTGGDGERIRRKYGIDGPVVLHVGMKAYDKGSVTLLEAMKRLWSQGSAAWLIMAGPSLTSFDDYIESSGSFPRLINLPPFSEDEKPDLLASADVVVQPSRVESLGLVLIEAWANAKPVIAADIRVSRELITECHGGAVVPFGESVPLAECIATMLGQPELRVAMGQRGRQFVLGRYESSLAWERNRQVLESVLQDSGKVNKTEMAR